MVGGPRKLALLWSVLVLGSCYRQTPRDADASTPDACGTGCAPQPDAATPSRWQCQQFDDGTIECTLDEDELPGDGWYCHFENAPDDDGGDDHITCYGPLGEDPGGGNFECVDDEDSRICRDDDPSYPDEGGEEKWDCFFDELGGLWCTTADPDMPGPHCEPGIRRWCSNVNYDGWCIQTCQVDRTWEPCGYECSEDRPNNACGCRHFYFTPDCCERPDCVIPDDHVPEGCPIDGGLCGYCTNDDDCGGPDDLCLEDGEGATFCGILCTPDAPCPGGFECKPIRDYNGNVVTEQCAPLDPDECAPR